jgi:hypothetical protein
MRAERLEELLALLKQAGEPALFPAGDWPGYEAELIV